MINLTGVNQPIVTQKKKELSTPVQENIDTNSSKEVKQSSQMVTADMALAQLTSAGKKTSDDPIMQWIKNLPFADDLSPNDRRELANFVKRGDEEADYMKKMIHLICKDMVTPYATSSLCQHGIVSELVKEDIDTYYDKVQDKGMSIKDAFVPLHSSQKEGQDSAKVGDVFRVNGQDKIYIKSGDNTSRQLDMDADAYLKMYPPVQRYASCQSGNGDCYLLSSVNAVNENPYSRAALLDCFHQDGNDMIMQIPGHETQVRCKNMQLPLSSDLDKYTEGPTGMKLIEYMYGKEVENQKYNEYQEIVSKEMKKMDKELSKWEKKMPQDNLALKKQKEVKQRIENWTKGQAAVDEAMKDPNHKMVFVLDDELNFVIGKFGPMTDDVSKVDSGYSEPGDYYTGGKGGFPDIAISDFGFLAENYETGIDDDEIDKALFAKNPNEYIIAASTPDGGDEGIESPQETAYSIYSSHAYKVLPFNDKNGKRMFEVTNPWNQSHRVIMDETKLKSFFESFAIAKVNESGANA